MDPEVDSIEQITESDRTAALVFYLSQLPTIAEAFRVEVAEALELLASEGSKSCSEFSRIARALLSAEDEDWEQVFYTVEAEHGRLAALVQQVREQLQEFGKECSVLQESEYPTGRWIITHGGDAAAMSLHILAAHWAQETSERIVYPEEHQIAEAMHTVLTHLKGKGTAVMQVFVAQAEERLREVGLFSQIEGRKDKECIPALVAMATFALAIANNIWQLCQAR
ncbi:MAG: hypothetical protein Q7R81_02650 [Candidatus Peregrinibacteria bacterium]|nr:hypothetical protein [Candidatus Peregrinibacteria bacterium]